MPLLVVCFSCQREGESQAAGLPGETVPEVSVMTVRSTQVPVTANLPGRMEAYLQAEVRARVTGIIQERCYQEGQTVRPGDLLFKIDPAPLQAVLDECKAAVARARAVLSDAEDKAARYSSLVAKGAVSIREHKQARAEEERARAEYAAAAASLEQARLNLEYTRVEAPISGRVRRALVTEGAFANQNEFTHLTTIEQIDPIYVRFSQPASQYSSLRRAVVSGLWKGVPLGEIKVRLLLSNGEEYPHSGRIIFSDMAVDPNTDTIEMRALFPNPDHEPDFIHVGGGHHGFFRVFAFHDGNHAAHVVHAHGVHQRGHFLDDEIADFVFKPRSARSHANLTKQFQIHNAANVMVFMKVG